MTHWIAFVVAMGGTMTFESTVRVLSAPWASITVVLSFVTFACLALAILV